MTLEKAISFAAEVHAGQTDKAGEPYILHPLRVMLSLSGETERTVAVLHDVLEDTDTQYHELLSIFGGEATEAVYILSRAANETYVQYIKRIRASNNQTAINVKIADLKDNLSRAKSLPQNLKIRYTKALKILES